MRLFALGLLLAGGVWLTGCGTASSKTAELPKTSDSFVPDPLPRLQRRFEPITATISGVTPGSMALDTFTGKLCRTWDWHYKPDAIMAKTGIDLTTPLCADEAKRSN